MAEVRKSPISTVGVEGERTGLHKGTGLRWIASEVPKAGGCFCRVLEGHRN